MPSLFTLSINDKQLTALQGLVVDEVTAFIPGTKMKATGPLLLTHWGMSGPAILKLSSYAARWLAEHDYQQPLSIKWTPLTETEVQERLHHAMAKEPQKQLTTFCPLEFVTCGGIALSSVNAQTLESKHVKNLYFAGEVLDIDGITGGFNFQAAWTTAYTVAKAICEAEKQA